MKLLHLKAHNVFSIGTIELYLKDRGLLLVTGWSYDDNNGNMSGKSSLARNSIVWGLFGKTVDGVRADAVVNTSIKNAKHCGVTIHFEGIDGEDYRIYRARKPASLVFSQKTYTAEGSEWFNLTKRNERDTQALIDKLLGRDHKTFIQSDFFGQGREKSFLSLPGSEQRAVIEEILPLNSLDAWADAAYKAHRASQKKVDQAAENCRLQCERVSMAYKHLEALESQKTAWSTDNTIQMSGLQHNLNKIQLTSSGVREEIKTLRDSVPRGPIEPILSNYYNTKSHQTAEINHLGHRIDTLTSYLDRRAARPEVCSECDRPFPIEKIKLNETVIEVDKKERDRLIKQRGEHEAKLYFTEAQIGICREIKDLMERIKTKEGEATLVSQLDILKKAPNPFRTLVLLSRGEYEKEQKISDTYHDIRNAAETRRSHYLFWDQAFSKDLKTLLFNQVCPFLEVKANGYLADLNNGQIRVSFSTIKELKSGDTKDQFCVTAKSDTGSITFELFSGAEKQLTSFAVGMALSDLAALQTSGASKFMILDEPFLYQSPENCENIVNFLTTHLVNDTPQSEGKTVLLISNEDNLANLIPNRVHVVKRNGVSSLSRLTKEMEYRL